MTLTPYEHSTLQRVYEQLSALEPVRAVRIPSPIEDGTLALVTTEGRFVYSFRVKRTVFPKTLAHVVARLQKRPIERGRRHLLVTDYVSDEALTLLRAEKDVDYVDEAGNMLLRWPRFYVEIRGHKRAPSALGRARPLATAGGIRALFALLAEHSLEHVVYRELEAQSGVTLGTISNTVKELRARGFLGRQAKRLVRSRPQVLLDLWAEGYAQWLRPRLVIGRYQSADPLENVVDLVRRTLKDESWGVTGGFAAEIMTRHYRGETLGLFIGNWRPERAREWRWLPSADGPITVFRPFSDWLLLHRLLLPKGPVVHPLLVYAELVCDGRERARAAAERVREQYLDYLSDASAT